ncbi:MULTISPECIES: NAD(P)H-dependent flavin oxidoreductase [Pelosinus]|uniref:Probable nitronate monooxygenase n=2 Tax=Pelosinus TaxID=365348 RepID=I8U518_9FIRM|nr:MULTISPECIES: nitronate monooxygenase [Pelosinus]AJQ27470.1 2-nitropropane dioxygenase NPD [Pelosinus fermentans JBW45]MCC5465100.1 nitronate monooxygenase [Pelosinus baikalensis]
MKLPELKIGNLVAKIPIIQGGMAIRISTAPLAAAVGEAGGIGLIAASGMSFDELRKEIRLARSLTSTGIIGINAMVAAREFAGLVKTAIEEGIDLVVAGAGFSRDMFGLGKESGTPIVPIVSSAKLAKISESLGASAVIVEGKEAGGHLGTDQPLHSLLPSIKNAVKIPVIGAGGIISGQDIVDTLRLGADGVQMGTRFAASEESNAAPALKAFYLKARPEDIVEINSPVGMPGRALLNPFAEKIIEGTAPIPESCDACLKHCKKNFCIIKALIRAQQGDVETGLVFTGEYIHKIDEILPVKEIFNRLLAEVEVIN